MKYDDLIKNAEKEWTTEGPNSGGMAGYILFQGKLYAYRGEWSMPEPSVEAPISVDDFLKLHGNSSNPRIQDMVKYFGRLETRD